MNLFFFGGAFDPPHIGHYNIVKHCLNKCDKLIIVPNKKSVNKKIITVSYRHRLHMLRILFSDLNVEIDDFEINSSNKNYTFYTIEYLLKKYSDFKITMVIGEDQALNFQNWYRSEEIKKMVDILYFNRNQLNHNIAIKGFEYIKDFDCNISSSMVRKILKNEPDYIEVQKYIQSKVFNYIRDNNLYV